MGLFSLFKKSTGQPKRDEPPARGPGDDAARLAANTEAQVRQREIARATAMKIDAIEAAMVSDIFNTPEPSWNSGPRRAPRKPRQEPGAASPMLAQLEGQTTLLLGAEELPTVAAAAQTSPVVEETAMLYANNQIELAERMLVASLADAGNDRTVWWMLFDLYQVTARQEQFDDLSIDYASKFETSPPAWIDPPTHARDEPAYCGVMPTQAFSGMLDGAIEPALDRLQALAADSPVLRLEFNRVTGVEPAGCTLLLRCLQALQARHCELIVVAAAELAGQIRAILRVGRRDDTQASWLLLLELLQLLNREKEFEETSMDYCVTFEESPPSFTTPKKVATAARQYASASSDRFMLPAIVDGDSGALLSAIKAYAAQCDAIVFDCSRLTRIDCNTAAGLLAFLKELAFDGKKIEFRDLNHLVAALLRLLDFSGMVRIFPRRY